MTIPFSGKTTNTAQRGGNTPPKMNNFNQYANLTELCLKITAGIIPHIPPQKASEINAGIAKGLVAVMTYGALGTTPS